MSSNSNMNIINDNGKGVIVEIKNIYTCHLVHIMTPLVYEGLVSLYEYAKFSDAELQKNNHKSPGSLELFKKILKRTQTWNRTMIEKESNRIKQSCEIDYFDELVKGVVKSHIDVLTCCDPSFQVNKDKYHDKIDVPDFVHKCYIQCSNIFFNDPFLFLDDDVDEIDKKDNQRTICELIRDCIMEAVRRSLQTKSILQEYLIKSESMLAGMASIPNTPIITHPMPEPIVAQPVQPAPVQTGGQVLQQNPQFKNINELVKRDLGAHELTSDEPKKQQFNSANTNPAAIANPNIHEVAGVADIGKETENKLNELLEDGNGEEEEEDVNMDYLKQSQQRASQQKTQQIIPVSQATQATQGVQQSVTQPVQPVQVPIQQPAATNVQIIMPQANAEIQKKLPTPKAVVEPSDVPKSDLLQKLESVTIAESIEFKKKKDRKKKQSGGKTGKHDDAPKKKKEKKTDESTSDILNGGGGEEIDYTYSNAPTVNKKKGSKKRTPKKSKRNSFFVGYL